MVIARCCGSTGERAAAQRCASAPLYCRNLLGAVGWLWPCLRGSSGKAQCVCLLLLYFCVSCTRYNCLLTWFQNKYLCRRLSYLVILSMFRQADTCACMHACVCVRAFERVRMCWKGLWYASEKWTAHCDLLSEWLMLIVSKNLL